MSNKIKIVLMIIAGLVLVVIGVAASLLLITRSQASQPTLPTAGELDTVSTGVVVVTRDITLGDRLVETDVELIQVPAEMAPRTILANTQEAVGKMIKSDLVQGQMVLSNNLADPTNNNKDLSFILNEEHVLMAFPADDLMSRESIVQRGDIVDIYATFYHNISPSIVTTIPGDEESESETKTFTVNALQKVNVTALVLDVIEQNTNSDFFQGDTPQGASRTTIRAYLLALNPQEALIMKYLKDTGAIFDFVLRAPTSTIPFELTPVTEEFITEFYGLEMLP